MRLDPVDAAYPMLGRLNWEVRLFAPRLRTTAPAGSLMSEGANNGAEGEDGVTLCRFRRLRSS